MIPLQLRSIDAETFRRGFDSIDFILYSVQAQKIDLYL